MKDSSSELDNIIQEVIRQLEDDSEPQRYIEYGVHANGCIFSGQATLVLRPETGFIVLIAPFSPKDAEEAFEAMKKEKEEA